MIKFDELLMNFFETLKKEFVTWIAALEKVDELKDLGCYVRGKFLREALFTSVRTVKTGMYVRSSVRSSGK